MAKYKAFTRIIDEFLREKGFAIDEKSNSGLLIYKKNLSKGIDIGFAFYWVPNVLASGKGVKKCAQITIHRRVDNSLIDKNILSIDESLTMMLIKKKIIGEHQILHWKLECDEINQSDVQLLLQVVDDTVIPYLENPLSKPLDYIDTKDMEKVDKFILKVEKEILNFGFYRSNEEPKYQFVKQMKEHYIIFFIGVKKEEDIKLSISMAKNIIPNYIIKKYYSQYKTISYRKDDKEINPYQWSVDDKTIENIITLVKKKAPE